MHTLLWEISLQRCGLEGFCVETVGFSQKKSQKMSGDFVAQQVSLIWAALDGHHELDFYVSSLVWRLGAEHAAIFCGDATNVTSWQRALAWQLPEVWLVPSVLRCYPLSLVPVPLQPQPQLWTDGSGSQTGGWLDAFLVESLDWLLTSLNFLTAVLDKCLCWRWPGREGWQDQPLVVVNCFQNHALVEKATKGSIFKKCLIDCMLCLLSELREINESGIIEFVILALVFLSVEDFCIRTFKQYLFSLLTAWD